MAADLQPVPVRAQMVGVMDDPAGEPENLAFKLRQKGEPLRAARGAAERGWRRLRHLGPMGKIGMSRS
jgi:hypothetical protein